MAFTPVNLGNIQQTVSSSAAALGTIPQDATEVIIETQDNAVRVRWDGTDPTTTVGNRVVTGAPLVVSGRSLLENLKLIAVSTDAVVNLGYN